MTNGHIEEPDQTETGTVLVYVVGGSVDRSHPAARAFPVIASKDGESPWSHVMRVARAVRKAIAAGGTHLLVPREHADWLSENPLMVEYFAARHEVVEASAETGLLFALRATISSLHEMRGDARQ